MTHCSVEAIYVLMQYQWAMDLNIEPNIFFSFYFVRVMQRMGWMSIVVVVNGDTPYLLL